MAETPLKSLDMAVADLEQALADARAERDKLAAAAAARPGRPALPAAGR